MKKIDIYIKTTCPYCVRALATLDEMAVPYEKHTMDATPDELENVKAKTGHRTVPIILINDELIGGNSELQELIESGKFEELIKD